MPSTFDPLLRLELQATGENIATWGVRANNNFSLLGDAIAGFVSIDATGSGNLTLTASNASTDQSRRAFINLTGTLSGARTVIIPSSSKIYVIRNATSGAFTLSIKTASGNSLTIPQGALRIIACDGTDVYPASGNAPFDAPSAVGLSLYSAADQAAARAAISAGYTYTSPIATTSGSAHAFTGLPAGVRTVEALLSGVSQAGGGTPLLRLGTGAGPTYATTGYDSTLSIQENSFTIQAATNTTGFALPSIATASNFTGIIRLTNFSGNKWVADGSLRISGTAATVQLAGEITLGAALTAVQLSTPSTFDAGEYVIHYGF